jgi:tetraacyldisaccharide 4'-kinase
VDTLKSLGHNPHILTRGFGGNFSETVLVETAAHSYKDVGDEALLLANTAPTWVGHDRSQSARQAINNGATILIMDDGLHNHSLNKDITFTVIDALQGIGNGRIFPAGPLRYSFKDSLDQTHAIIKIGKNSNILASKKPQFYAEITSIKQGQNKDILGFCGIGYPDKFKNTLKNLGYSVIKFQSFADHHPYTNSDLEGLIQEAQRLNVTLITTQKDWLRVPKKFQETVEVLPIQLKFNDEDELKKYIFDTLNLKMEQQI